ncbi:MAG: hypothetical protein KDC54_17855 [Lewinella sp.]|nr:hypothetical protein [Lewinella sp.]
MQKHNSGWVSLSIALGEGEIDLLLQCLTKLLERKTGHFHFRAIDYGPEEGVADVEWSIKGEEEQDNMTIE